MHEKEKFDSITRRIIVNEFPDSALSACSAVNKATRNQQEP